MHFARVALQRASADLTTCCWQPRKKATGSRSGTDGRGDWLGDIPGFFAEEIMQFAIWLVALMCHLTAFVRDTLQYRLHPKQGRVVFHSCVIRGGFVTAAVFITTSPLNCAQIIVLFLFCSSESFIKQLSTYEIITPLRVNDFGESFPHNLHYRRRRRSLTGHLSGLRVHYRIDAFGGRFHLNLTAHSDFIAPSYTVVHLGTEQTNDTDSHFQQNSDMRHCFFHGHVNGMSEYPAALSLCTGLVSILTFPDTTTRFPPNDCIHASPPLRAARSVTTIMLARWHCRPASWCLLMLLLPSTF